MVHADDLMARLDARVAECQRLANGQFPEFPVVRCSVFTGRRAAGLAFGNEHRIAINRVLLEEHPEQMLRDTVAHEFAHVVVWWNYRMQIRFAIPGTVMRPRGHGREWKATMRELFAVEPLRCHRFDTSNTGARMQRRWPYRCGCRPHLLSTAKHRRAQSGARYFCTHCDAELAYENAAIWVPTSHAHPAVFATNAEEVAFAS